MLLLHNIGHFTANVTQMCRMKSIFFVAKMMMHLVSFFYILLQIVVFLQKTKGQLKKLIKTCLRQLMNIAM